MPRFNNVLRAAAFAAVLAGVAGCSEYVDRRDMISIAGGDAVQSDKVTQMVDPWPRHAADRNIAYDGAVIEGAVSRYRSGNVIRPVGTGTSASYQPPANPNQQNNNTPLGPTVNGSATAK